MDSIEVANYIILHEHSNSRMCSNLRLQCLLYFSQLKWLREKKQLLFDEQFVKWYYANVVPEVYYEYKVWGAIDIGSSQIKPISFKGKEIINDILDYAAAYPSWQLAQIIREQSIWKKSQIEKKIDYKLFHEFLKELKQ